MPYTPVELRHVKLRRGFFGYRRAAVDDLVEDVADSFETVWRERGELEDDVHELQQALTELKRREELLAQALVAAEQAASETRAQANREAELIVAEAHQEARLIVRGAQSEQARFTSDARRVEALLRGALGMVEEAVAPPQAELQSEPYPEPQPEEKVDDTFAAARRRDTWPRRDDTREFPRGLPSPPPEEEQEAHAG
jgi:cell division septum initiation protein DivIVA